MKIFINITTWTGIDASAIHYYAKMYQIESEENIYKLEQQNAWVQNERIELTREIDAKEARFLNKKDGKGSLWKAGMKTERFNSKEQLKEFTESTYPNDDIMYLHDMELESEDADVVIRSKEEYKKTGLKITIHRFKGFSREFANLIEGSVHEVIETPERYKGKKLLHNGYWVHGVSEPVLVIDTECYIP